MPRHPLTPDLEDRITKLEAHAVTGAMQHRAILNSLQSIAESLDSLTQVSAAQRQRIDTLEATWRARMAEAVQLVMDWDAEPTWDDVWSIDQANTDLTLTYRIEDVPL
jgi:hypothetical protein